jgi:hypothetical protein
MSQINTNGINVNYPVPGVNNSTQGFRDNFAQITSQLNIAANELTDLQNNVVLKSSLANTTLNNDMANTLISNASTRGFRATTYNMGNALSGTVLIDVSKADVQYGSVTGNVVFQFGGWSPTNTQSNVVLNLTIANANAFIAWPSAVVSNNNNYGTTLLENFQVIGNVAYTSAPANVSVLQYQLSSVDCGNSITISPINRPFESTQIITRDVPSTGLPGDISGTIAVSPQIGIGQVNVTQTANVPTTITANTFSSTGTTISGTTMTIGTLTSGTIAPNMLLSGGSVAANTYIVSNITGSGSGSTWVVSVSQTLGSTAITGTTGIIGTTLTVGVQTSGNVQPGMVLTGSGVTANTTILKNISGSGSGSTWRVSASQYAAPSSITGNIDIITTNSTTGFYRDMPITFTGTTFGNITVGNTYYVNNIASTTAFTISNTPGGAMQVLSNASGTMYGNPAEYLYVCSDTFNSNVVTVALQNTYNTTNYVNLSRTNGLANNCPIIFTGNTFGNIVANTVYYVKSIIDVNTANGNITISQSRSNGVAGSTVLLETANGNATATAYVGNDIWRRINLTAW